MSIKGFPTQQNGLKDGTEQVTGIAHTKVESKHGTLGDIGGQKVGLDTLPKALYPTTALPLLLDAGVQGIRTIRMTAHGAKKGDVVRFIGGLNDRVELGVKKVISANELELDGSLGSLAGVPNLPVGGTDEIRIMRHITLTTDLDGLLSVSSGPIQFNRGPAGVYVPQTVIEDTTVPANTRPLPVKIHSLSGDNLRFEINAVNADMHVQLSHFEAGVGVPDSVRIGGVLAGDLMLVNPLGEAHVEAIGRIIDNGPDVPATNFPLKIAGRATTAGNTDTYTTGDIFDVHGDLNGRVRTNPEGGIADNAVDDGSNPLKIGGLYRAILPTYGDGDRTTAHFDINGRLLTINQGTTGLIADDAPDSDVTNFPVKIGAVAETAGALSVVSAVGDMTNLKAALNGALHINIESQTAPINVAGAVADNAVDAGNPVKISGRATTLPTTDAYTTGDRADLHMDLNGRARVTDDLSLAQLVLIQANTVKVADNAVDAGDPSKIGGRATTLPTTDTYTNGDRFDLHGDLNGRARVTDDLSLAQLVLIQANTAGGSVVTGNVADNAVDAGNPVKTGGRATTSPTTDTYANADRADTHMDLNGRTRVLDDLALTELAAINANTLAGGGGSGVIVNTNNYQETIWHAITTTLAGKATNVNRTRVVAMGEGQRDTDGDGRTDLFKFDGTGESSDDPIDGTVIEFTSDCKVSVEFQFGDGANEQLLICTNRHIAKATQILETAANSIDTIGASIAFVVSNVDGDVSDTHGFIRASSADASSLGTVKADIIVRNGEFMWFQQQSDFSGHSAGWGRHQLTQNLYILSITAVEVDLT